MARSRDIGHRQTLVNRLLTTPGNQQERFTEALRQRLGALIGYPVVKYLSASSARCFFLSS
jgi:hypothetical protein